MFLFNSLLLRFQNFINGTDSSLDVVGISSDQWNFFIQNLYSEAAITSKFKTRNQVVVCPNPESAETFFENLKHLSHDADLYYYPGLEVSPYGGIISSERNLFQRFAVLNALSQETPSKTSIIITTLEALSLKAPPKSFFKDKNIHLEVSEIISPDELAKILLDCGYSHAPSVEERGTFSKRGEIFDIFPIAGNPIRIHYFDDMIEEIHQITLGNQKTIKDKSFSKVVIGVAPGIVTGQEYLMNLRENIPMPSPQYKNKFEKRKKILSALQNGLLFDDYAAFYPLFFQDHSMLLDFIPSPVISIVDAEKSFRTYTDFLEELRNDYEAGTGSLESEMLLPAHSFTYIDHLLDDLSIFKKILLNELKIETNIESSIQNSISLTLEKASQYFSRTIKAYSSHREYIKAKFEHLKNISNGGGKVIFCVSHQSTKDEIIFLCDENAISHYELFDDYAIKDGFYYPNENLFVLSEGDLFAKKVKKTKFVADKKIDLFAEQLSTLKTNDYVIHSDYGLGRYLGLESLDIGKQKSDFLVLLYDDNDKVYVPVYKMNLIQKHADSTSDLKIASLRTNKFNQIKARAKESAKKLAIDLLKLQAERESSRAFSFSAPDHDFKEFELAFPFEETPDQTSAIQRVIVDMQKQKPMDHLVCGDVGFGKTEVAMRASFKAVLDGKQVSILVPTTILALQHYHSFKERFKNFPVEIDFLSRFKTPKQVKEIKEKLLTGNLDIIIGTHKILSESIRYKDLGLVIVDEEQRFGVAHKEKLKLLKTSVDFLTMTATPIPRTLQLAFLGLRDLSLIQTAPPKRQSIKSYIIKEDDLTIQQAIKKEISRGGQVFFVHNRVQELDRIHSRLIELVPEAKIVVAHGQMSERELEKKVSDFYSGKYNVLLSTTIIESGLDIPNANTMIINRADRFGLSQLHQLRGRIGRSDKKAYAYFVIPQTNSLSEIAERRLKALQTYAEMGSGFSIASCDLEIRGAGDILGAEQSGHIESIGLELYMELLKEAIAELKGEKRIISKNIEIQTPFPSYIPNSYVSDSASRLKLYKRLSNCESRTEIDELEDELVDLYGKIPHEVENLLIILESRIMLQHHGLKSLKVTDNTVHLIFDKTILEKDAVLRNKIIDFFIQRPKVYKFTPDYKVIYNSKDFLSPPALLQFAKDVAQQIDLC